MCKVIKSNPFYHNYKIKNKIDIQKLKTTPLQKVFKWPVKVETRQERWEREMGRKHPFN